MIVVVGTRRVSYYYYANAEVGWGDKFEAAAEFIADDDTETESEAEPGADEAEAAPPPPSST